MRYVLEAEFISEGINVIGSESVDVHKALSWTAPLPIGSVLYLDIDGYELDDIDIEGYSWLEHSGYVLVRLGQIVVNVSAAELKSKLKNAGWYQAFEPPENDGDRYDDRRALKRKIDRWLFKLKAMPEVERRAIIEAITNQAIHPNG